MKKAGLLFLLLLPQYGLSQNEEINLEAFAERLFQAQDEPIAYEDIYESLLLYYTHKLNLNSLSYSELASLYLLSPAQLSHFFAYREKSGGFLSLYELQAVPLFDLPTIYALLPFVTLEDANLDHRPLIQRLLREENNYLLLRHTLRLEKQVGYTPAGPADTTFVQSEQGEVLDTLTTTPNRYLGDANKIYGRFRTQHKGDFSLGFTFEKDQGETIRFNKDQKGVDFYSYHLLLENKLGLNRLLLGDFQVQAGQGLVFGAGFNPGKGAETIHSTKRNTLGLRPYTSVLESGFFRGVGMTKSFGTFQAAVFFSGVKQDATIRSDSSFSALEAYVNSIQQTGLHRTQSQLNSKNQILESTQGGWLLYRPHRRLEIGVTVLNSHYSVPLKRLPNNYNQFEFQGTHNQIFSSFGHYTYENFIFFGELARSKSGGTGAVGGLMGSLSKTVDFSMVLRDYKRDFHSFYANAFAENTRNINEKGVYWGISIAPNRKHKLNAYYDRFRFPWLKFGTDAPSRGHEWLARYTHTPQKKVVFHAQIRQQVRQVSFPEAALSKLVDQTRLNYMLNMDYRWVESLTFRTRIQGSHQTQAATKTRGFALVQDFNCKLTHVSLHTRTALFQTDDFANAQYVYENDVLYAFSIPAYHGTGIRQYAMVRIDPLPKLTFWIRYARYRFINQDMVGSGLEQSAGSLSSEIKFMLRLKF